MRIRTVFISAVMLSASGISRANTMSPLNDASISPNQAAGELTISATALVDTFHPDLSSANSPIEATHILVGAPATSDGSSDSASLAAGFSAGSSPPASESMTGYAAGALCSTTAACSGRKDSVKALLLLGSGVLGMGLMMRKRYV